MGDRDHVLIAARQAAASREKSLTLIYAVMACLVVLILFQFLLLMVSLEEYLAGGGEVLFPAAIGSGVCFVGSCLLIGGLPFRRSSPHS